MANELTYNACAALFAENKISLPQTAYEKLRIYAQELISESETQNVTAVRTEPEIWHRHYLDSAYLLPYLPQGKIIDIGTGGGIPGIPLAILNPALRLTLLDSELRKIEFCRRMIRLLEINAEAVCGRAEELARKPEYAGQFDFAVSRAMATGSMLTELSVRFLKAGGKLIAMKGRQYDRAAERFQEAAEKVGCMTETETGYLLENEQKYLIMLRKITETPEQYPRRFAKIKRNPL